MRYPDFFDKVEPIKLYDPLSDFLGAFENGELEITYLDVVKFAGHSCPTVAGAFLMAKLGLKNLFDGNLPTRGEVKVFIKGKKDEGVEGVIGNTIAFICGVTDEAGFKGIGGKFNRANKLFFNADIPKEVRLQRVDNEKFVDISYDPSIVPPNPDMKNLMQQLMMGNSSVKDEFGKVWQERVEKILLSKDLWEKMIKINH
ncbi:FmdE family protein [Nitrosophilus kaiyonis]|uniref:FmdE family protein n=1 Tax=Nitrosophilus kaiyonis TaxID=2930200 RepID=UPI002491C8A6|nr:FmdE family protein [Nitrosophilus kaiyonis]